jgi:predicted nucleotidyltransferase
MNVITLKTFSLAEATNASLVELVNSESVLRSEEKTKEKEKKKKGRKKESREDN